MKLKQKLERLTLPPARSRESSRPLSHPLPAADFEPCAASQQASQHLSDALEGVRVPRFESLHDEPAPEPSCDTLVASALSGSFDRLEKLRGLRAQLADMRAPRPEPERPRERRPESRVEALDAPPRRERSRGIELGTPSLPCESCETPHGRLHRVLVRHAEDHRHGSAEVVLGCRARGAEVALLALDPSLSEIDFSRALYIDTETTGLAGGAGTLPFLIGMAWFEGECLAVEQLLLPRPGLEAPMLAQLAERLATASAIVSYNGKSFDWPLLRTRFILNRIAAPKLPGHLDLLHCARRVYKTRLGSVRLLHLEQELLGFERCDDMPGELIPQTYLAYLRGVAPGSTLQPILDHNRSDLVALPALLGEMVRRFGGDTEKQDARDQLGFARVAARGEARDRALALAHAAIEADVRGELAGTALSLVAELKLRAGDVAGAQRAFEEALEACGSAFERARIHLALAKLHEHRTKQLGAALYHARETGLFEGPDASARRCGRLATRLERARCRVDS